MTSPELPPKQKKQWFKPDVMIMSSGIIRAGTNNFRTEGQFTGPHHSHGISGGGGPAIVSSLAYRNYMS